MHFFVDYTKLTNQDVNSNDPYGPRLNEEENIFDITSGFLLTGDARAYAPVSGYVIIQPNSNNSSLVNLILSPKDNHKLNFTPVKYFVFRGIKKDGFINSNGNIVQEDTSNNDLIKTLWQFHSANKTSANNQGLPNPSPTVLGYDTGISGDVLLENLFLDMTADIRAFPISEGDWIGTFTGESRIGFDIVLDEDLFIPDIAYARSGSWYIDVGNISDTYQKKFEREKILNFIDPAAFYGLFYLQGLYVKMATSNSVLKTGSTLYSDILNYFETRNRVYFDIRSEKGYSLNYYGNYDDGSGNSLKIGDNVNSPVEKGYETEEWPILCLDGGIVHSGSKNTVKFNLIVNDNTKPLIYILHAEQANPSGSVKFLNEKRLLPANGGYTKEVQFRIPNFDNGGNKKYIPWYIKIFYCRQEYNPSSPNSILKNQHYLDSAFCPIDLTNISNLDYLPRNVRYINGNLVVGELPDQTTEFVYIAESGAYWDDDRILFYARPVIQYKESGLLYGKDNGLEKKLGMTGVAFAKSFIKSEVNVNCKTLQEEVGANQYEPFNCISILHNKGTFKTKESILLLGIRRDELNNLIDFANEMDPNTQLPRLSQNHHHYLFLEEELPSPKLDKDENPFRKFKLKIQGVDHNGASAIISPSTDIFLYSSDGLCFTSKEFSEYENVNIAVSTIEIIPFNDKEPYASVKRLSINITEVFDWQLFDLDGKEQKYGLGENNYFDESIEGELIKLPVGTRTIILGVSKETINNSFCNFILCYHEGKYREGFVDINAFTNSNKGTNDKLVRINELEGLVHPQVLWKPFLDDASRILDYCERINSLSNVFQPFSTLISQSRSKFTTLLSQFTPYNNPQNLNSKLLQLNEIVQSKVNKSNNIGNIGLNSKNIVDTIERWKDFAPLKSAIIDHVCGHGGSTTPTNGFKSMVFPLTIDWFNHWTIVEVDSKFTEIFNDPTPQVSPLGSFIFQDILESDVAYDGASNIPSYEKLFFVIKHVLKKLIESFSSRQDSSPILLTPEVIWLKTLNPLDIDNITNFIVLGKPTWDDLKGEGLFLSSIASDHSIGYLNNVSGLSALIHEINTWHNVKNIDGTPYSGSKALFFDTHGKALAISEFDKIQNLLVENNTSLNYFDSFYESPYPNDGPWLAMMTTPHHSILYLHDYLTKILVL